MMYSKSWETWSGGFVARFPFSSSQVWCWSRSRGGCWRWRWRWRASWWRRCLLSSPAATRYHHIAPAQRLKKKIPFLFLQIECFCGKVNVRGPTQCVVHTCKNKANRKWKLNVKWGKPTCKEEGVEIVAVEKWKLWLLLLLFSVGWCQVSDWSTPGLKFKLFLLALLFAVL